MALDPDRVLRDLIGAEKSEKKRRKIPKAVRVKVWDKYIGADKAEGKCYVCGRTIHITDFEVGHNKAVAKGGSDNINNLRPICRTCNLSMGTMSIETFKNKYFKKSSTKQTKKKTAKKKRGTKPKEKDLASELSEISRKMSKDLFGL